MADLTRTDTPDDTGGGSDRRPTSGSSRWQKVVGAIGLVVLVALGSRMFGGGGDDGGGHAPPAGVPDHGQP